MFKRLNLPPGINKESTAYSAEGSWYDSNNIRFRGQYAETVGGWLRDGTYSMEGIGRSIFPWTTYEGYQYDSVGTNWKQYLINGNSAVDITAIRKSGSVKVVTAVNLSSTVTITDTDHGCVLNDFVTFSSTSGTSGSGTITDAVMNSEYQVTSIVDLDNFTVKLPVVANSHDVSASITVSVKYQTNVGLASQIDGAGWGAGLWNGDSVATTYDLGNNPIATNITDATIIAPGISQATEAVVTATNTFSDGDVVYISGVVGMTEVNTNSYVVSDRTGSNFKIKKDGDYVDSSGFTAWSSGGTATTARTVEVLLDATVRPSSPAVLAVGDQLYLQGLSGTDVGGVNLELLNDQWWTVTSVADLGSYKVVVDIRNQEATSAVASGGGTDGTYFRGYQTGVSPLFGTANPDAASVDGATRGWGDNASVVVTTGMLRTISVDNYGEDLIFCNRGGPLYYWDASASTNSGVPKTGGDERAKEINQPPGDVDPNFDGTTEPPTIVMDFLVSDRDGHVVAFGCNDWGGTTLNSLLVRWSDQNNPFDWEPTSTNTSGGQMLRAGSQIIAAVATKEEILVWTDVALYSMRYVGPPSIFSFNMISQNVRILAGSSAIDVANVVYFMGTDGFYAYRGAVSPLGSSVEKYVFNDINLTQKGKIFAGSNASFNEIYWFYPSSGSIEPDRWVSFNYVDNVWAVGNYDMTSLSQTSSSTTSLNRTAWVDSIVSTYPKSTFVTSWDDEADTVPPVQKTGVLLHEFGTSANSQDISCYIESADVEISDEGNYSLLNRVFPDIQFLDTPDSGTPEVTISVTAKDFPGSASSSVSSTSVQFVPDPTDPTYTPVGNATAIRGRGRALAVKFSSLASSFRWRLGDTRIDMRPDGRR